MKGRTRRMSLAFAFLVATCIPGCATKPLTARALLPTPSDRQESWPRPYSRPEEFTASSRQSLYVPMRDGTRLAVDVYLPKGLPQGRTIPAVLFQTRYWRRAGVRFPFSLFVDGQDFQGLLSTLRNALVRRGYAWVDVDVRGSGASFGSRPWDYAPDEIRDASDLADWITRQRWSSGRIVTAGSSYTGSTAEFSLVNRHPAIRAAFNMSSEFDQYTDILFPGGVPLVFYLDGWGALTRSLDENRVPDPGWQEKLAVYGVARTDGDSGDLLEEAVKEHATNYDFRELKRFVFRDDFLLAHPSDPASAASRERSFAWLEQRFGPGFQLMGIDLASQHAYRADIEASGAQMYLVAGWFDGTYANAMIKRFKTYPRGRSRLLLGPWDHHFFNISPWSSGGPSRFDLLGELLKFVDGTVGGSSEALADAKPVHYYTLGVERWREAEDWPPPSEPTKLFLSPAGRLRTAPPGEPATGRYRVDHSAGTGRNTRWNTLMGRALRDPYPDRAEADRKLLVFETEPLPSDTEVTGHPVLCLQVRSTATDGAFFAYLEDVAPGDLVHYVTEGQLRALHRKPSGEEPATFSPGPYRTFRRADSAPLVPGERTRLEFELHPTSYVFKAGHRIRLALSGADKDHFAPVPPDTNEPPVWSVELGGNDPSYLVVPVVR